MLEDAMKKIRKGLVGCGLWLVLMCPLVAILTVVLFFTVPESDSIMMPIFVGWSIYFIGWILGAGILAEVQIEEQDDD